MYFCIWVCKIVDSGSHVAAKYASWKAIVVGLGVTSWCGGHAASFPKTLLYACIKDTGHTHKHTYIYSYIHTFTYTDTHTLIHTQLHLHTQAHIHNYIYTHIYRNLLTQKHSFEILQTTAGWTLYTLDFKKAFDKVSHIILLWVLEHLGSVN